jgi:alpha-ribazole phosphatase
VPEGGESLAALDERVKSACTDLLERASHQNIVVVSHVSPMKSAVAWALGVDIGISWNCHLDHASICRVAIRGRRPILTTFNETV